MEGSSSPFQHRQVAFQVGATTPLNCLRPRLSLLRSPAVHAHLRSSWLTKLHGLWQCHHQCVRQHCLGTGRQGLRRFLRSNIFVAMKQENSRAMQARELEFTAIQKDEAVGSSTIKPPSVKICGVTNVNDAVLAAQAGARFVGMILWQKSKRSIPVGTAKEIAHAVHLHKAEPVGVFVDEDAETIIRFCTTADIGIVQLHGEGARASLADLPSHFETIYVVHVDKSGVFQTPLPEPNSVDWILLDSLQGGSGHSFDWEELKTLSIKSRKGWLLAGGLNPDNVATAISMLKPDVVDVSSGVTMSDGLLKDPARVLSFIDAVKGCPNPL